MITAMSVSVPDPTFNLAAVSGVLRRSARVEAAAAVLRELGGDVEVEADGESGEGWLLRGYGCPLSAVVREYPEICALTEALVAEITGRAVSECCEREPRPSCAFRIASAPAT